MKPESEADKTQRPTGVAVQRLVRRLPRWKKYALLALVAPLAMILGTPKMLIEIAEEWDVWAKGIGNWWREL
jgi:hypothetical protein